MKLMALICYLLSAMFFAFIFLVAAGAWDGDLGFSHPQDIKWVFLGLAGMFFSVGHTVG